MKTSVAGIWKYNARLLQEGCYVIERLKNEAISDLDYASNVGPHLRHVIEHYTALSNALREAGLSVNYDNRNRNMAIQSDPDLTRSKLTELIEWCLQEASRDIHECDMPLNTHLQSGEFGESRTTVPTSLGRELLFLASHTIHHFAILATYFRSHGVELGADFGKAPSTLAHERQTETVLSNQVSYLTPIS
ncbi:hypothetical protein ACO0K7_15950 [Undibacterium sp. Ji67W]|uniref:hypothetical protein n=1 Tax=Undibacterium sp. Ji67W TaxID=3413042 RepID=UPI003BF00570